MPKRKRKSNGYEAKFPAKTLKFLGCFSVEMYHSIFPQLPVKLRKRFPTKYQMFSQKRFAVAYVVRKRIFLGSV